MINEDKELLLKDLCARLPYGVIVEIPIDDDLYKLLSINSNRGIALVGEEFFVTTTEVEEIRPYLFPLSSMTEEQKKEVCEMGWFPKLREISNRGILDTISHLDCVELMDWLLKNHFDYRGLIPKDLAIDATGKGIYNKIT